MSHDRTKLDLIFTEWMESQQTIESMSQKYGINRTTLSEQFSKRLAPKKVTEPKPETIKHF
jgi:uncharacterized protein YidB (DUF937 family)